VGKVKCLTGSWALGIEARIRALWSERDAADRLYRDSIQRLGRTRLRAQLARGHLLYGEWLRRKRRRADARKHLPTAHDMLITASIEALAKRAQHELPATDETERRRTMKPATSSATGAADRAARPRRAF
jgi:hypothetical protein